MTVIGSGISWTNSTWNWATGCTPVSAGCDHCYAAAIIDGGYFSGAFKHKFADVTLHPERLSHVRRFKPIPVGDGTFLPHLVFTNSMSDPWHDAIPEPFIHQALDVMERTPHAIFQMLTKRPIRARRILVARYGSGGIPANLWIGVSAEDNRVAARLSVLRSIKERTGGKMTAFVSVEPIVGPTDELDFSEIDWAIFGGESGPKARIMRPDWLNAGIENASKKGAAIWLKQHGQIRSNPLLHHAPANLGITGKFNWLIENGLEVLGKEKGGATLEGGVTYRQFPPHYHAATRALNTTDGKFI